MAFADYTDGAARGIHRPGHDASLVRIAEYLYGLKELILSWRPAGCRVGACTVGGGQDAIGSGCRAAAIVDRLCRAMLAELFVNIASTDRQLAPYVAADVEAFRTAISWGGALRGQMAGDLRRRIAVAIKACRDDGVSTAVVIGSDAAPQVDGASLSRATTLLRSYDVVVWPSLYGSFYLLGIAEAVETEPLLGEIASSPATMLASLPANADRGAGGTFPGYAAGSRSYRRCLLRSDWSRNCPRARVIVTSL